MFVVEGGWGRSVVRRVLAVLLIFLILVAAAAFLAYTFSGSSVGDSVSRMIRVFDGSTGDKGGLGLSFVPGEVVVKLRREASEGEIAGLRSGLGLEEAYLSAFSSARVWRVPPSKTVEEWVEVLGRHPLVEYAEPNYYFYSLKTPNDPLFGYQWHLDNAVYGGVHVKAAWDMVTGASRVVVAVVDTGVAYEDYVAPSYWHIDIYRAYSGHSWWCGVSTAPYSWTALYGSASKPPGYGNGWKEYLQHAFDLRSATGTVTFSYWYRYDLEYGYDFAYVEVSSDGGESWVQLKSYTGPRAQCEVEV